MYIRFPNGTIVRHDAIISATPLDRLVGYDGGVYPPRVTIDYGSSPEFLRFTTVEFETNEERDGFLGNLFGILNSPVSPPE